jgi:hypothetical protein
MSRSILEDAEHQLRLRPSQAQAASNEEDLLHLRDHIGKAQELGLREEDLVYDALRPLIASLVSGHLTEGMRFLLADFLVAVIERRDPQLGAKVLGHEPPARAGAPRKDKEVLWWEAHSNYEHWIEQGHSDEEALRLAWETYYPDKAYDVESKRPAGVNTTAYEQQIEKIKSMLNQRGSREPAKRGRKPKTITP